MAAPDEHSQPDFVVIRHEVPRVFLDLAARLGIDPGELARMLCENLAHEQPDGILIISDRSADGEDWLSVS